jgi:hypothetical protein
MPPPRKLHRRTDPDLRTSGLARDVRPVQLLIVRREAVSLPGLDAEPPLGLFNPLVRRIGYPPRGRRSRAKRTLDRVVANARHGNVIAAWVERAAADGAGLHHRTVWRSDAPHNQPEVRPYVSKRFSVSPA